MFHVQYVVLVLLRTYYLLHAMSTTCSFLDLLQKLISGLSVDNPLLPTILSSLKEVAKIDADMFEGDVDSVIKDFAVKKVLRRDDTVGVPMNSIIYHTV